jgi:glycosyltransferase involved in cell wall biosynthesis
MVMDNSVVNNNGPWIYVISLVESSLPMEWFFAELHKRNSNVLIVFLNPAKPHLMDVLSDKGYRCLWLKYSGKKSLLSAFWSLFKLFRVEKPSVVHAHLFDACLVALPSAALANVKRRIHTRHHASHHHFYFPHAVKYDRFINYWSTKIFAISQNVKDILVSKEGVSEEKVSVVHHGFDFANFKAVTNEGILNLENKYNLQNRFPVIGVISRYTHWKGIQYTIPAFKKLLKVYPDAVLVLANAKGDFLEEIKSILTDIPAENYREIIFEKDSATLYKLFDVFVHVPVDDHSEAFGQVYVEAMVAEIPCVYTISGIANEYVKHRENALVVDYMNSDQIYDAIVEILASPNASRKMAKVAHDQVLEIFDVHRMVSDTILGYA